jgi:hypothetical protein
VTAALADLQVELVQVVPVNRDNLVNQVPQAVQVLRELEQVQHQTLGLKE